MQITWPCVLILRLQGEAHTGYHSSISVLILRLQSDTHTGYHSSITSTIFEFSFSRSSNVLSSDILPNSDRMVVCAIWSTAYIASCTPYEALYGSTILTYSTPSMVRLTLSLVMACWLGTVIACSFRLCTYEILSAIGIRKLMPGLRTLWNFPNRSTTYALCCGTTRTPRFTGKVGPRFGTTPSKEKLRVASH